MAQIIAFLAVAGLPLLIFFINSGIAHRERRGIAAGIPRPKTPKTAKPPRPGRSRPAKVRQRRVTDCGRTFTHLALAMVGSRDSCRYCSYLQEVPEEAVRPPADDTVDQDSAAAVRAAEEIIDQAKQ